MFYSPYSRYWYDDRTAVFQTCSWYGLWYGIFLDCVNIIWIISDYRKTKSLDITDFLV